MSRILIIDDEPMYLKLIARALEPLDCQVSTAPDGMEALQAAQTDHPDLVITDVNMPDISGYEVTRRLRREPEFAHTPIIVLTTQAEIQDKIKAFEAGADDYITKPFEPAELAARVGAHLRQVEALQGALVATAPREEAARLIVVHSLRGGTGCSSLAVNVALGLAGLWGNPTLLLDLVLMAGQVTLMLNATLKRTWSDLSRIPLDELDMDVLRSIMNRHDSGLEYIAAPTYPVDAEMLTPELLNAALNLLRPHYDYILADLQHDFSDISIQMLDAADLIVVPLAPEMSSVRAAAAALDTYTKLGYPQDKIQLVLNSTFPRHGFPPDKIEAALSFPITMIMPYTPDKFVDAINLGQPLLYAQPNEPVAGLLEDFAFHISRDSHKQAKPAEPSAAWKRVQKRFIERRK